MFSELVDYFEKNNILLILIAITGFILYYCFQSNTLKEGLAQAEAEAPTVEIESGSQVVMPEPIKTVNIKESEKEFREELQKMKMMYNITQRKEVASDMRNIIFKFKVCQNEDIDINICLNKDEYQIYQEMKSLKTTRGKFYKDLKKYYEANDSLPLEKVIEILIGYAT